MKKILIVDTNYGFTSDVESRLILEEIENVEVYTRNQIDNLHQEIQNVKPDELLVCANLLDSHPSWDFGIPVKTYSRDSEGIALSNKKGFPCYGIIPSASLLIEAIQTNKLVQIEKAEPVKEPAEAQKAEVQPETVQTPAEEPPKPEPIKQEAPKPEPKQPESTKEEEFARFFKENEALIRSLMGENTVPTEPQKEEKQPEPVKEVKTEPAQPADFHASASGDFRSKMEEIRKKEEEERRQKEQIQQKEIDATAKETVEAALGNVKKPARVITVYSAKGGVGKTTISCELATFLSLTAHGRGHFRVCIVDLNVVFGDILSTLTFDPNKVCMTQWIQDIQERHQAGRDWDKIQYTETEIEKYLQKKDDTGLYALIAPISNEDYMRIPETELASLLHVMLSNLIQNGGFDFIICDTGNNLDDAAYLALNQADEVLLVLTQSMNAANCNNSFLNTMNHMEFDMNKIRIVINQAKPSKAVGISVQELEEALIHPETRKPYPCYAKIKDFDAVRNAENLGEPMVFHSSHEFTKGIGEISSKLIGENFVLEQPEKKRGWFRRKKK